MLAQHSIAAHHSLFFCCFFFSRMSSIYDVFQLLPPPPRIALSTVPESERGRLPNFLADDDPAAALKLWARHIFYPNIDSTWIHVYITTAFLSALMVSSERRLGGGVATHAHAPHFSCCRSSLSCSLQGDCGKRLPGFFGVSRVSHA